MNRRRSREDAPRPLGEEVLEACDVMARHAIATGKTVPERILELLDGDGSPVPLPELVRAHQELAALVAPALPQALVALDRERRAGGFLRAFGPVRIVRQLIAASLFFLAAFVASSVFGANGGDVFSASGVELLASQLFLLSAAGVGASFAGLFRVSGYLNEGTYDPRYDGSYWIRLFLGLIAGVVLGALVPVKGEFTRPLLALGGGFAAPVVYRLLSRIVQTVDSVGGGAATAAAAATAVTAVAKTSTPEGDEATLLAASAPADAPAATAEIAGAAPPAATVPAELEGEYKARIVFDGGHVGAARVVEGSALARAAGQKLKAVAKAAAIARLGAEISGPWTEIMAATGIGGGKDEMKVVVEDGVATGALHEWATGAKGAGRDVVLDLHDEGGTRSSTLKLKDSHPAEYAFEENPNRPGTYLVKKLVLTQSDADWFIGSFDAAEEVRKLMSPDAKAAAPPAPPPAPCKGSFSRGVAAGLALALAVFLPIERPWDGEQTLDERRDVAGPTERPDVPGPSEPLECGDDPTALECDRVKDEDPIVCDDPPCNPEPPCKNPPCKKDPHCKNPPCNPEPPCKNPPCNSNHVIVCEDGTLPLCPDPPQDPVCPDGSEPPCKPRGPCDDGTFPPCDEKHDRCDDGTKPPCDPKPPGPHCDDGTKPPCDPRPPGPHCDDGTRPPCDPEPPCDDPPCDPVVATTNCKQPPGAVITSVAHSRHPGCARWHSSAEPPGHGGPHPAAAPPRRGDPPVPLEPEPVKSPGPPASPGKPPEAVPPGLVGKGGLPPGQQKKARKRRRPA